jgi:hypothetical protein
MLQTNGFHPCRWQLDFDAFEFIQGVFQVAAASWIDHHMHRWLVDFHELEGEFTPQEGREFPVDLQLFQAEHRFAILIRQPHVAHLEKKHERVEIEFADVELLFQKPASNAFDLARRNGRDQNKTDQSIDCDQCEENNEQVAQP